MIKEIYHLKELGFTVWMDDYGSGYSSPSILAKVPFDYIKIDMLFVRQLKEGDKARIILTEIVRLAMALGMDTIAEGVETQEHVEFLKDIGCTMLQGFYFCKAIPLSEIVERNRKGVQIGYENPDESGYYAKLGKVNMYDLSVSSSNVEGLRNYSDTWPMVIVECNENNHSIVRCNMTFKNFVKDAYPDSYGKVSFNTEETMDKYGVRSISAIIKCAKDGKRVVFDDFTSDGRALHLLIWRIAVNPVTAVAAVMIAVLSVS